VKTLPKVCGNPPLSDAFHHRIHNEYLRAQQGIGMLRRWAFAKVVIEPELTPPREVIIGYFLKSKIGS